MVTSSVRSKARSSRSIHSAARQERSGRVRKEQRAADPLKSTWQPGRQACAPHPSSAAPDPAPPPTAGSLLEHSTAPSEQPTSPAAGAQLVGGMRRVSGDASSPRTTVDSITSNHPYATPHLFVHQSPPQQHTVGLAHRRLPAPAPAPALRHVDAGTTDAARAVGPCLQTLLQAPKVRPRTCRHRRLPACGGPPVPLPPSSSLAATAPAESGAVSGAVAAASLGAQLQVLQVLLLLLRRHLPLTSAVRRKRQSPLPVAATGGDVIHDCNEIEGRSLKLTGM